MQCFTYCTFRSQTHAHSQLGQEPIKLGRKPAQENMQTMQIKGDSKWATGRWQDGKKKKNVLQAASLQRWNQWAACWTAGKSPMQCESSFACPSSLPIQSQSPLYYVNPFRTYKICYKWTAEGRGRQSGCCEAELNLLSECQECCNSCTPVLNKNVNCKLNVIVI